MSDNSVEEIEFEDVEETLDPNEVDLPPMDNKKDPAPDLNVSILGRTNLSKLVQIMYGSPLRTQAINMSEYDTVDDLLEFPNTHLVFITLDTILNDNDEIEDAEIINAVKKISSQMQCSIVLKTTVSIETLSKIAVIVEPDRFVYCPEDSCDDNLDEMLASQVFFAGGTQKAVNNISNLSNGMSMLSRKFYQGSLWDVALAKLMISAEKAVTQTFWNQAHDYIVNDTYGNFNIIKKMCEDYNTNLTNTIPSFLKARLGDQVTYKKAKSFAGEYRNKDVRLFVGLTDKLPLIDECINFKNLKD